MAKLNSNKWKNYEEQSLGGSTPDIDLIKNQNTVKLQKKMTFR